MLEIDLAQERIHEALRMAESRRLNRERQALAVARHAESLPPSQLGLREESRINMAGWAWKSLRARWFQAADRNKLSGCAETASAARYAE